MARRGQARGPVPYPTLRTSEAVFHIGGMWCKFVRLADRARAHQGERHRSGRSHVRERHPEKCATAAIRASRAHRGTGGVARLPGHGVHRQQRAGRRAERRDLLLRVGIAAFLSMNVMMFSLVLYASYFEPITSSFGPLHSLLLMALATPSVFYCAAPVFADRWAGRARRCPAHGVAARHGILMAYGYSAVQAFRGDSRVYFDTACAIVTLVAHRQRHRTRRQGARDAGAYLIAPPDAPVRRAWCRTDTTLRLRGGARGGFDLPG